MSSSSIVLPLYGLSDVLLAQLVEQLKDSYHRCRHLSGAVPEEHVAGIEREAEAHLSNVKNIEAYVVAKMEKGEAHRAKMREYRARRAARA